MRIPQVRDPRCSSFERYKEVPETVPLELLEEDVTWVSLKLSCAVGALGEEALELKNWLIWLVCAYMEIWVEVAGLVDWL